MKKNCKIVLKFGFLFFFFLFFSCTIKPSEKSLKPSIIEGQTFKGKVWWKLEIFNQREENRIWGGYADFETGTSYFYLLIKNIFGGNLAFLKWELENFQEISLYDFKKGKVYLWIFKNFPEIQDFPMYFLGFKKEKKLQLNSYLLNYIFFEKEQKGTIFSEQFKLEWQIKEITLKEDKKSLKEELERISQWEIEVFTYSLQGN